MRICNGAVLRSADDGHGGCHSSSFQFQVVSVTVDEEFTESSACVYTSDTGMWGSPISTKIPTGASPSIFVPSTLVGSAVYWLLDNYPPGILEFDLDTQNLTVIEMPVNYIASSYCFQVITAEGGGLGFLSLSDLDAQLWKRKTDCDGVASWVLENTINLDNLFSISPEKKGDFNVKILGFADDSNVVFMWTDIGIFMVQLESMQFKKLLDGAYHHKALNRHLLTSVYGAGLQKKEDKQVQQTGVGYLQVTLEKMAGKIQRWCEEACLVISSICGRKKECRESDAVVIYRGS